MDMNCTGSSRPSTFSLCDGLSDSSWLPRCNFSPPAGVSDTDRVGTNLHTPLGSCILRFPDPAGKTPLATEPVSEAARLGTPRYPRTRGSRQPQVTREAPGLVPATAAWSKLQNFPCHLFSDSRTPSHPGRCTAAEDTLKRRASTPRRAKGKQLRSLRVRATHSRGDPAPGPKTRPDHLGRRRGNGGGEGARWEGQGRRPCASRPQPAPPGLGSFMQLIPSRSQRSLGSSRPWWHCREEDRDGPFPPEAYVSGQRGGGTQTRGQIIPDSEKCIEGSGGWA